MGHKRTEKNNNTKDSREENVCLNWNDTEICIEMCQVVVLS